MAEKYVWHKIAWNDYQKWIKENKAIAKKIFSYERFSVFFI